MIRNETFSNGICITAEVIDLDAGTYQVEDRGQIVDGPRPLTLEERQRYGPQPLDRLGALAALLAATEVLDVEDAANAVGLTAADLVTEAEGWAAAESNSTAG